MFGLASLLKLQSMIGLYSLGVGYLERFVQLLILLFLVDSDRYDFYVV
jgi:hypothetical protein